MQSMRHWLSTLLAAQGVLSRLQIWSPVFPTAAELPISSRAAQVCGQEVKASECPIPSGSPAPLVLHPLFQHFPQGHKMLHLRSADWLFFHQNTSPLCFPIISLVRALIRLKHFLLVTSTLAPEVPLPLCLIFGLYVFWWLTHSTFCGIGPLIRLWEQQRTLLRSSSTQSWALDSIML